VAYQGSLSPLTILPLTSAAGQKRHSPNSARSHIEIAPSAERQIRKLESSVRRKILKRIETLGSIPRPAEVEKLTDTGEYRVRLGDYRIIYDIEDKVTRVLVLKVGDRMEIHRR
jgi:mRNA interferase RelE/StbE